jgi:hypothetical protein
MPSWHKSIALYRIDEAGDNKYHSFTLFARADEQDIFSDIHMYYYRQRA